MRNWKSLGTFLYRAVVIGALAMMHCHLGSLTYKVNTLNNEVQVLDSIRTSVDTMRSRLDTLEKIHPWKEFGKKPKKLSTRTICKEGTFFGFIIYTPVDTSIHEKFKLALSDYAGPTVKINSLKRRGNKSMHCKGMAMDVALDSEVVEYLLREDGRKWLDDHGLSFMIEGKPGSEKVGKYAKYAKYSDYVFFNDQATGDHIHIAAKRT